MSKVIINAVNLEKHFPIKKGFLKREVGTVRAVDGVDIEIRSGETYGLVGESGCGKSTLGRTLIRALPPTGGEILYTDQDDSTVDIAGYDRVQLRAIRQDMQMIFQDPYSSLNPRMTVKDIISEPLICAEKFSSAEIRENVETLMDRVGLDVRYLERYPHAFSGGQRQRIGVARALALNPRFIVCDEPVSALDVSIQAQIINLLKELQDSLGLSYLFISHDLSVVQYISTRVGVMYIGHLVETADTQSVFDNPQHPYTKALLLAKPIADPRKRKNNFVISGEVGSPSNVPKGCRFCQRCPCKEDICSEEVPELREVLPGHKTACHFPGKELTA